MILNVQNSFQTVLEVGELVIGSQRSEIWTTISILASLSSTMASNKRASRTI